MNRYIDADKLMPELEWLHEYDFIDDEGLQSVINVLDDMPTVDAVPVVRCKDCKHYYADPWGYGSCVFEGGVSRRTKTSDYCSWGGRREDGHSNDR